MSETDECCDDLRGVGRHRVDHGVDWSMLSWCLLMNDDITPKKSDLNVVE